MFSTRFISFVTLALCASQIAAAPFARGGGKGCSINGVSVGDCTTVTVGDILNNDKVGVLSRGEGEDKSCEIHGISILVSCSTIDAFISDLVQDCSSINIGDIGNDLTAKVLSRGESGPKSCKINGVSVLDCSEVNVYDIANDAHLEILSRGEKGCEISGVSAGDCTSVKVDDIANNLKLDVLSRGEASGEGCKINGVSVGDCSTVKIGDIANDLHAKVLSRGEGESKSCTISGVSVLVRDSRAATCGMV